MKKDKWWGYLILLPMVLLTAYSYHTYLSHFMFSYPKYLLICLFCIIAMIIYPLYIFKNKKIKITGLIISIVLIVIITIINILNPPVYSTHIFSNNEEHPFDDTYKVELANKKYGDVSIEYLESIEDYMIKAEFKKEGKTELILTSPSGEKVEYTLDIKRDTYDINKKYLKK